MAEIKQLPSWDDKCSSRIIDILHASKSLRIPSENALRSSKPYAAIEFGYYASLSSAKDLPQFEKKIEQAIIFLEKKGIELLKREGEKIIYFGTKENHTGRAIYFFDEDGNIAEFIERESLNFENEDKFSIKQIIKINEIGISVDDPMEVSRKLINLFKIHLIDLHHLNDAFCWVGDFNGVFIVVKNGRNWLPTKLGAKPNDFEVEFESSKEAYKMEFKNGKFIPL